MSRLHYRSIFISDIHLGLRDCQAAYLLDFLRSTQCDHLYLVGDIVDFENIELTPFWHPLHSEVLVELLGSAARGTRVIYIPGNHDAALRRFAGQRFAGVEIALKATHVGADGRRYRVSHGDEFDGDHDETPRWLVRLGDVLQGFICGMNRIGNRLRRALRLRYRPISLEIKMAIGAARKFIRGFETRVGADARAHGYDGHICGHIHYGRIDDQDGVLYINDGDWVEHCTALVEHGDGRMELLHWTERQESLAVSVAPLPEPIAEPLPVAA